MSLSPDDSRHLSEAENISITDLSSDLGLTSVVVVYCTLLSGITTQTLFD